MVDDDMSQSTFLNPEDIDTSPPVSDEVKTTTCYMCACRCGINVHLRDGAIRYIEGNRNHPVNKGVLCAKGSAGIMQHYSPARLSKPLKRVGPRGSNEFVEIEWDEALATATEWLGDVRRSDPRKLAFFTGRDQSQGLTGFWASQFGTPNYAAHGGFCSVNMAAAGLYTIGGSFWEFGEPDWEHTRFFLMFGVAEDHDSNPIKAGLGKLKAKGDAKFVSVNPVRTGYSAIADEWLGVRPGTDGLFVLALVHELLRAGKVDLEFLVRYTNAPWLVYRAPGEAHDGMFVRNTDGDPLAVDQNTGKLASALAADIAPALQGSFDLAQLDGGDLSGAAVPSFQLLLDRYQDPQYAPEAAAGKTGIDAATIRRIAAELAHAAFEQTIEIDTPWTDWTGRRHDKMIGRPVSMHAMRGISAHSNGFQTCRAIHMLQMLLGSIDCPGGFRYKPPFPRPAPPGPKPVGRSDQIAPETPMPGPPLGFITGPEDLLVEADGQPVAHRQGILVGIPAVGARYDASGHPQRLGARSLPHRRAVPVHGQYELELGDEHVRDHRNVDRHRPRHRRVPHPQDHLFRRLCLGDGALRRSYFARHHLSRALGLHQHARPADQQRRRAGGFDPPAGCGARPRRAAVPGCSDRSGRAPEPAGLRR